MDGSFPVVPERRADTSAVRGVINGVLIALGLWAVIAGSLLLVFR